MAQVSYGTITINDLTDITDIYLEYALVADTVTREEDIPSTTVWNKIYPTWQQGYQIWIRQVTKKEGIDTPEYGTPYLDTAVNQINNNYIGLDNRLKAFFWPGDSNYPGAYSVAKTTNTGLVMTDISTYGFNTRVATAAISMGYNNIPLLEIGLLGDNFNGIKLYSPSVNNQGVITDSIKGIELTNEALKFYQKINNVDRVVTQIGTSGIFMNPNGIIGTNSTVEGFFIEKANNNTVGMGFRERATASHAAVATNYSFAIGGEASFGVEEYGSTIDAVQGSVIEIPTQATGKFSFAQGSGARALHDFSTAIGEGIVTGRESQLVIGKWNKADTDAIFVIGNGSGEQVTNDYNVEGVTADEGRSNLLLVTNSGDLKIKDGFKIINDSNNYIQLDSDSMDIYQDDDGTSIRVAMFGADGAQIGENNYAHIEITSDSIQGKGITNKSFFDFNGNGTIVEMPLSQSRSYNLYSKGEYFIRFAEFNELPVESRTIILNQVPISTNNYKIDISLDIYTASTNEHTIYWSLQIQPGVAGTFTSQNYSLNDSSTTYNIQVTYDGDKTISHVVLIINGTASSNYGIHELKVNYYATTSSPTYSLGDNISSGAYSFAVGDSSSATGNYSYAQGKGSIASNECSYAIGRSTVASGSNSQAMGIFSQATANNAFASGYNTIASGLAATATGWETQAKGNYSNSFGYYTEARGVNQTVIGVGNDPDTSSLFIIGNGSVNRDSKTGTITVTPSNALTVDTSGNTTIAGTITMNNGKYLQLNSGAGSSYSWNQIWSNNADGGDGGVTSNLYLQADGYIGFYVGTASATPTGRMYVHYSGTSISGTLSCGGKLTVSSGGADISGGLTVTGGASVSGGLDVTGVITGTSSVEAGSSVIVGANVRHDGSNENHYCGTSDYRWTNIYTQAINASGNLTLGGHSSVVGTVVTGSPRDSLSLASGTAKYLDHLNLPAGKWIARGRVRFPANASGVRRLNISTTQDSTAIDIQIPASSNNTMQLEIISFLQPGSTTTYYLNAFQNSGSSLTASEVSFSAMRIV